MNTKILQKAVDELKEDAPRLDYIRGLLETLIEMHKPPEPIPPPPGMQRVTPDNPFVPPPAPKTNAGGKPAIVIQK